MAYLQRLYEWFYNNCRTSESSVSKTEFLDLAPKRTQKLLDYQAYLRLHKEKLAPIVSSRYEAYKQGLGPDETPDAFIKFQAAVAKELLEEEPEDVRAAVEAYRNQGEAEPDEDEISRYVHLTPM